jgi:DNA-binding transcriptional ArsR family regulator
VIKVEIKEKIIKLLQEHPEGLTVKDIAQALQVSRITTTKYIFELKGEGLITRRRVGSAILHYLNSQQYIRIYKGKFEINGKAKEE